MVINVRYISHHLYLRVDINTSKHRLDLLYTNTHLVKLHSSERTHPVNSGVQARGIDPEHAIKSAPCGEYAPYSSGLKSETSLSP